MTSSHRRAAFRVVTVAAVLSVSLGYAGDQATTRIAADEVRVERVITSRADLGRHAASVLLSRVTGRGQEPLFDRPYGVAWDGPDLLVTDTFSRRVTRIGANGRLTHSADGVFEEPVGVVACWGGVAVSDSARGGVGLLDSRLSHVRWIAEDLARPTGLACAGDELAIVETGAHRLLFLRRDGTRRTLGARGAKPEQFNYPVSVAIAGDRVFVGDALNFRVQQFDVQGNFVGAFGQLGDRPGTMPRLKGLAIDSAGRIWIADAYLDSLAVHKADGKLLLIVGRPGSEPGAFSFPAGLAFRDDGALAVADSLNRRVQVIRVGGGTR